MARSLAYPTFDDDRSTMHDDEPALAAEDLSETGLETMQGHDPAGIASNFVRKTMGAIKLHTPHTRVHITEIIGPNDPRAVCPEMQREKLAEMKGLLAKGVFEIVVREEIPPGSNTLGGRYVLAWKDPGTDNERWKARFVVQGHNDIMKRAIVLDTATLSQRGARMIFAMAAIFGWKVWTEDVRQAYIQTTGRLVRDVFLTNLHGAEAELKLKPHEALRLLRPLYGLTEAGDLWHAEFTSQYRDKFGMVELQSEPALYAKFTEDVIRGVTGLYVDDTISAGTNEYEAWTKKKSAFETQPREFDQGNILGQQFSRDVQTGRITLTQEAYARKLKHLQIGESFAAYRSHRMEVAWLVHTRPDIAYEVARGAQVTESQFGKDPSLFINDLNNVITHIQSDVKSGIIFPRIDFNTAHVCVYTDASFANNMDLTSQIGYVVLLMDDSNNAVPLAFRSTKAKRVTRSVIAAEAIALIEGCDAGFCISHELQKLLGRHIALTLATDSQSLFTAIARGSATTERRLLIDLAALKMGYLNHEIDNLVFVRSTDNLADALTKRMVPHAIMDLMRTAKHKLRTAQRIVRVRPSKEKSGVSNDGREST
jgi:Reverse transcriptase (RNA-dependent DNA polymerase)